MKKTIFSFIFAIFLILPCVILLTACSSQSESTTAIDITIQLNTSDYVLENDSITVEWGGVKEFKASDFKMIAILENNSTTEIPAKTKLTGGYTFSSTLPTNVQNTELGDYYLTFSYKNYEIKEICVHVVKKNIDLSNLTWNENEFSYNGFEKSVYLKNLPDGVIANYSGNRETEVGDNYLAIATLSHVDTIHYNVIPTSLSHSWKINKGTIIDTTQDVVVSYDGQPHCSEQLLLSYLSFENFKVSDVVNLAKNIEVSFDNGETWVVANSSNFNKNPMINAGIYNLGYRFTFDNYNSLENFKTISVEKINVDIPQSDQTEFIYNGEYQTYSLKTSDLYTIETDNITQFNAGTYTIKVALNDKLNYVWSDGTIDDIEFDFIINKATIFDGTQNANFVFNGQSYFTEDFLINFFNFDGFDILNLVDLAKTAELSFDNGKTWIDLDNLKLRDHPMTDVGVYYFGYKFTFDNYNTIEGHKTVTINEL